MKLIHFRKPRALLVRTHQAPPLHRFTVMGMVLILLQPISCKFLESVTLGPQILIYAAGCQARRSRWRCRSLAPENGMNAMMKSFAEIVRALRPRRE